MNAIGPYRLEKLLGRGGMADVWLGRDLADGPISDRLVAIKRLLPAIAADDAAISLFSAEARLAATLRHPNIVEVHDSGLEGDAHFLVMEYVEGTSLAALAGVLATRGRKLSLEAALYVAAEVSAALSHAHGDGDPARSPIIHRDVSPQNILLSREGEVKLCDFGIARIAGACGATATGQVRGKLPYLSPEQARQEPLDGRSDLFSLAIVLYELLSGEPLHPRGSIGEALAAAVGFAGPPEFVLAQLHRKPRAVLSRGLQSGREDRYQTAAEMRNAIEAALGPSGRREGRDQVRALVASAVADPATPAADEADGTRRSRDDQQPESLSRLIAEATQVAGTNLVTAPQTPLSVTALVPVGSASASALALVMGLAAALALGLLVGKG